MPPMYTDAKDWFEQNASEGGIDIKTIISFVLQYTDTDDIERWFGVNMDDDCDNPGAGTTYCSECHSEVNDRDYDTDLDMCQDCVDALEEEESEDDDDDLTIISSDWRVGYSVLCPRQSVSFQWIILKGQL